jgi:PPP family 3-phenylpropionic acid transporter
MQVIGAVVPARMAATAQAIYNAVAVSAAYALLMLASGWLYARLGGHAFWIMAALCAAAMPVAATLRLPRHES